MSDSMCGSVWTTLSRRKRTKRKTVVVEDLGDDGILISSPVEMDIEDIKKLDNDEEVDEAMTEIPSIDLRKIIEEKEQWIELAKDLIYAMRDELSAVRQERDTLEESLNAVKIQLHSMKKEMRAIKKEFGSAAVNTSMGYSDEIGVGREVEGGKKVDDSGLEQW